MITGDKVTIHFMANLRVTRSQLETDLPSGGRVGAESTQLTATLIRRHFEAQHEKTWKVACIALKLKNWERYAEEATPEGRSAKRGTTREEWSLDGFLDRLVKWMVVDDQVSLFILRQYVLTLLQANRAVDSQELRDLLLYCGRELRDEDIPHRDHIGRLIMKAFKRSWSELVAELAVSALTPIILYN
jgi:hypothetical protein